jgi:hypothetical protein
MFKGFTLATRCERMRRSRHVRWMLDRLACRDYSRKELAARVGATYASIGNWHRGQSIPYDENYDALVALERATRTRSTPMIRKPWLAERNRARRKA